GRSGKFTASAKSPVMAVRAVRKSFPKLCPFRLDPAWKRAGRVARAGLRPPTARRCIRIISTRVVSAEMATTAFGAHRGRFCDYFSHVQQVSVLKRQSMVKGLSDQNIAGQSFALVYNEVNCA